MAIVYKDLLRVNRPIYGPGPGGFFIKRFKKSGYSEAELLDLISGMDFSLAGADGDIRLEKKCKIIERAVAETHYTSWALSLIGIIASLMAGGYLSALIASNPTSAEIFMVLFLVALGIYAWFRYCFERDRTVLLCALNHITTLQTGPHKIEGRG